ncbi:MAG: Fe-S protein assembly co-chaperone HscB [Rickettsiales bacterium]|nr:Fe-S protein assembly co-chaperone HscB [Rickettsiales bacterium]
MQNYFTLLNQEESFDVNEAEIHRAYVALQQDVHPDRLIGKSNKERNEAVQKCMDGNDAYEVLKSPLRRAQHLLALKGLQVNVDSRDAVQPSQDLLMEMMELREQLADADSEAGIAQASMDIKSALKDTNAALADAFANEKYEQAAQLTIRLQYLGKSLEEAMARHYQMKATS